VRVSFFFNCLRRYRSLHSEALMADRLTLTLEEFAALDGVPGRDTLRRMIKENPDFPAKPGSNGVAYEIDVERAIEWLRGRDQRRRTEQEEREAAARQLALDMLGTDAAADLDRGQTVGERKALLEEEFYAIKVAEKRGDLIRKDSIEAAIADVIVTDARRRGTFVSRLSKRVTLTREQIAAAEAMIDLDRAAFANELQALAAPGGASGGDDA
jgi:hypothetical protein